MQERSRLSQIIEVSDKLGYLIEMTSGAFCVLLFATMTVVALLGVFFRYVMISPFEWTEELARFLMLSLSFLAINIGLRKREHIALLFVVERLPNKISKVIDYCVDLLIILFLIVLIREGYLMTTRTIMTGGFLKISMFWPYLTVPLGAFLALLQHILNMTKKTLSDFATISHEIS